MINIYDIVVIINKLQFSVNSRKNKIHPQKKRYFLFQSYFLLESWISSLNVCSMLDHFMVFSCWGCRVDSVINS